MAVGPSFAADGKSTVAVTHLASARSQNSGNGTLGIFIYGAFRGSFFSVKKAFPESNCMDRRMIFLFIVLGILCFAITLSEDTIRTSDISFQTNKGEETSVSAAETQTADSAKTVQTQGESWICTLTDVPEIRVVLSKDHSGQIMANMLTVSWSEETTVDGENYSAGSRTFGAEDIPEEGLCLQTKGKFTIDFDGCQDERVFTGKLCLYAKNQQIYAVNTLSLEEYTACVVPGEMPSYYPIEALKAQAVCARTYALRHQNGEEEYHADLGDTVSWQVFNSVGRAEKTDEAVEETRGEVILTGDEPAELYFFSTSYGFSGTDDVWNTDPVSPCLKHVYAGKGEKHLESEQDFAAYITGSDDNAWEKGEDWFRWQITFSQDQLIRLCKMRDDTVTEVTDIQITKRSSGYVATELTVSCGKKTLVISGEYDIRQFFSPNNVELTNQRETQTDRRVLPSGYFVMETVKKEGKITKTTLFGGGLGHGAGMSQNGAKGMAEAGRDYRDILATFFDIH